MVGLNKASRGFRFFSRVRRRKGGPNLGQHQFNAAMIASISAVVNPCWVPCILVYFVAVVPFLAELDSDP